jgi:1-deoxy-D-xylulose-5-phosphate synthase
MGEANTLREGRSIALLAFGSMVNVALEVADTFDATLVDMRFVKPIDEHLIQTMSQSHEMIVTIEENALQGGAGSAVNECLLAHGYRGLVLNLGIPDVFIQPESPALMRKASGLDAESIGEEIRRHLQQHGT